MKILDSRLDNLRRAPNANFARAFTMIEIAIALAVIAFALVAIIGVLPSGLNVQKENREDTIINQDGPYWVQAIRNGSKGLDYLTNYVDRIGVVLIDANTNLNTLTTNFLEYDDPDNKTGATIIGLLSLPKWTPYPQGNTKYVWRVEARSRGLTGSAVEQGTNSPDFSFDYLLVSEVVPFAGVQVPVASTNFVAGTNAQQVAQRTAAWVRVKSLEKNTSEIRLTFRWPLLPNGQTGPGRQIFRAIASGERSTNGNLVFLQPRSFVAVAP